MNSMNWQGTWGNLERAARRCSASASYSRGSRWGCWALQTKRRQPVLITIATAVGSVMDVRRGTRMILGIVSATARLGAVDLAAELTKPAHDARSMALACSD